MTAYDRAVVQSVRDWLKQLGLTCILCDGEVSVIGRNGLQSPGNATFHGEWVLLTKNQYERMEADVKRIADRNGRAKAV